MNLEVATKFLENKPINKEVTYVLLVTVLLRLI